MSTTEFNPEVQLLVKLTKFVLQYVNYAECNNAENLIKYCKTRELGNLSVESKRIITCIRKLAPKISPILEKASEWWKFVGKRLYVTSSLKKSIEKFNSQKIESEKVDKKPKYNFQAKQIIRHSKTASKLTFSTTGKMFCEVINDKNLRDLVKKVEEVTNIISTMWHPTRPVESVGRYIIAKHASIHYILSTHSILPSAECFTANDVQKIMHLPMEWIGALPRQEDTQCITKFIAQFADLFSLGPKETHNEEEDPLNAHARKCGQKTFIDIIRYTCDGYIDKPPKKLHRALGSDYKALGIADFVPEDLLELPPLDWNDQLRRKKVKIYPLPNTHPSAPSQYRQVIKKNSVKQEHNVSLSSEPFGTIKLSGEFSSAIGKFPHQLLHKRQNFRKSRALERASKHILYPREGRNSNLKQSIEDEIAEQEKLYENLVSSLEHHKYQVKNILKIPLNVENCSKPNIKTESIFKDLTKLSESRYVPNPWNPNRKIFTENDVKVSEVPTILKPFSTERGLGSQTPISTTYQKNQSNLSPGYNVPKMHNDGYTINHALFPSYSSSQLKKVLKSTNYTKNPVIFPNLFKSLDNKPTVNPYKMQNESKNLMKKLQSWKISGPIKNRLLKRITQETTMTDAKCTPKVPVYLPPLRSSLSPKKSF